MEQAVDIGVPGTVDAVLVGEGGFGSVYRAYQPDLDRLVAVKVLSLPLADARAKTSFARECQAIGRLHGHNNILTVYASGESRFGFPYIIMAFMEHGSLAERVKHSPLPWSMVVDIGSKIAQALQFAHDHNIVHRDVKPDNILLSETGEPCLADFGIAGHVMGTTGGPIRLTPAYAAPEVLAGDPATPLSDVYSLAATLFALLAGQPAFVSDGAEPVAIFRRVMTEAVPDLSCYGVPLALAQVVAAGMAKAPKQRPESAGAFAAQLEATKPTPPLGGATATEVQRPTEFPSARNLPGRRLATAVVLAVLLVASVLVYSRIGGASARDSTTTTIAPGSDVHGTTGGAGTTPDSSSTTAPSQSTTTTTLKEVVLGRDLKPTAQDSCHTGGFANGSSWEVGAVRMNNIPYLVSYYCNVFSGGVGSLDFTLGKAYSTFHVTVGFSDDSAEITDSVVFSIIGDGTGYLAEPTTVQAGQTVNLVANVGNTSRLTLMITEPHQVATTDAPTTVVWGNPTLAAA